ncbi:MAG: porin family protein [Hyphomonadaceae bacterium]|nr:porin family protein [Hyphomonadaceae bacterium]
MKAIAALTALAAAIGFAAPAQAQTGAYVNGGYTHYDADDVTLGGVTGRLGYRFHPNVAVEGEASFGVKDDNVGPVNVELDHAIGVFGVGILPVTPNFEVFGRVGYGQVKASASVPGFAVSADEDGFAFGGGAQYMFTDKFGVRGDYTRLEGDDDGVNTFSASAVIKF